MPIKLNLKSMHVSTNLIIVVYVKMFSYDIGTKQLQAHFHNNGPIPREHHLTGRMPATTYLYEIASDGFFIRKYAEVYGIPQPAARSGRAKNPLIYLSASQNLRLFIQSM